MSLGLEQIIYPESKKELSTPLHFTTLNFRDLCPEVCLEMHEEESNLVHD